MPLRSETHQELHLLISKLNELKEKKESLEEEIDPIANKKFLFLKRYIGDIDKLIADFNSEPNKTPEAEKRDVVTLVSNILKLTLDAPLGEIIALATRQHEMPIDINKWSRYATTATGTALGFAFGGPLLAIAGFFASSTANNQLIPTKLFDDNDTLPDSAKKYFAFGVEVKKTLFSLSNFYVKNPKIYYTPPTSDVTYILENNSIHYYFQGNCTEMSFSYRDNEGSRVDKKIVDLLNESEIEQLRAVQLRMKYQQLLPPIFFVAFSRLLLMPYFSEKSQDQPSLSLG